MIAIYVYAGGFKRTKEGRYIYIGNLYIYIMINAVATIYQRNGYIYIYQNSEARRVAIKKWQG